jgi:SAM-dependent methyltransferase
LNAPSIGNLHVKREVTNKIRFVIEDVLPPVVRDSGFFRLAAGLAFRGVEAAANFRKQAPFLSEQEYVSFYRDWPRVHAETDNSDRCVKRIAEEVLGGSVCDVGCGSGYLIRYIRDHSPTRPKRLAGVDIVVPQARENAGIEFFEGKAEKLPFADSEFDTVICTHVIEHILDYRAALAELRRITAKRLIIVVPREREGLYTFNPHFNFFPYTHSFLRAMIPVPERHVCVPLGRDIYYREDTGAW